MPPFLFLRFQNIAFLFTFFDKDKLFLYNLYVFARIFSKKRMTKFASRSIFLTKRQSKSIGNVKVKSAIIDFCQRYLDRDICWEFMPAARLLMVQVRWDEEQDEYSAKDFAQRVLNVILENLE